VQIGLAIHGSDALLFGLVFPVPSGFIMAFLEH
jgi:hypothetical protein